ncbi:LtrC [Oenococcus alcoholitolerans]|uniref:LtrC n=1 Tax=Oenococcus alcoholitolerans TaxID=931074 RepID=A0ABR4XQB2_9LACO|nr:LtrC [Oenococcus alcoholitolerans]
MPEKKISPILNHNKKSSIKEKHVQISGTNDFGDRSEFNHHSRENKPVKGDLQPTTTQRITFRTKEKIKLLAYFIDGTGKKRKTAFNDMVELLADLYIQNNLNDRQRELYKDMLEEKGSDSF